MYKVSALVTLYNVEQYIARCAESLFGQDYADMEFVFVDDGSPDRSVEIVDDLLKRYSERQRQVKVIRHERNRGLVAARNTAVTHATGDFVLWVDGDDWMEPGGVRMLVVKQLATEADIVSGAVWRHGHNGKSVFLTPQYQTRDLMLDTVLRPGFGHALWGRLIRRSLYEQNNIVTKEGSDFCEDYRTMPQLVYYADRVASIPAFVYHYNCDNQGSMCAECMDRVNEVYCMQAVEASAFLVDFFKAKESHWMEIAQKYGIRHANGYLRHAAKNSKRALFNQIRTLMMDYYHGQYAEIGWNDPFKRWFESHYWTLSVFLKTRFFLYHKIVETWL